MELENNEKQFYTTIIRHTKCYEQSKNIFLLGFKIYEHLVKITDLFYLYTILLTITNNISLEPHGKLH